LCFKVPAVSVVSTLIRQVGIGMPESNEEMPRKCFTGKEGMTKSLLLT